MRTWVILLLFVSQFLMAQIVIPRDTVTSYVTIRAFNTTESEILGSLKPGEFLLYIDSVTFWHKVRLPDEREGFDKQA